MGLQLGQLRGLFPGMAHEELTHVEGAVLEAPSADQEGIGARRSGEPGRLGVDEGRALPIELGQIRVTGHLGHARRAGRQRLADSLAGMRLVDRA